jgi:hypothetical protein
MKYKEYEIFLSLYHFIAAQAYFCCFFGLKFEHFIQLNVTKNVFNKLQRMRSAVEQLVYWSTAVLHSGPPAQSWASPENIN